MGLLSKLTGKTTPSKKPTDDVLLIHAMLLMAGADGAIEDGEFELVEGFMATLPEFEGKEFDQLLEQAQKIVRRFGNLRESVKALTDLSTPAVRTKCYVLAADIAMSSGDVDETVAEKPTAQYDAKWGKGFVTPEMFVRLVYQGV